METTWEILLGLVSAVLPILESRKEMDKDRVTEALNSLGDAFFSTEEYYETIYKSSDEQRKIQYELATKWDTVANLMRPFDSELSKRFLYKSKFWFDGEARTEEQIKSANIGLAKIRKDARFVLIPKQK
jgi:hypothetical protein